MATYDLVKTIIAYRRNGCETDWSNYIVLSERVREWQTTI
jgi:hypothetical protein